MWNTEPGILKPQVTPSPKKQNKTKNEIYKAKCTEINCFGELKFFYFKCVNSTTKKTKTMTTIIIMKLLYENLESF